MNKAWGIIGLGLAGLYWLQAVLVPIALAVLLTFLLSPVVGALQRRRLGRVPAVLVTVVLALAVLGGVGFTLTRQLITLANELPRYSLNIHRRIAEVRGAGHGGSVEKMQKTVEDVVGEIRKTDTPGATRPAPIAVVLEPPSILAHLPTLLQALASAVVVTVLAIFMLLERRELRDRVILLIGYRRVTATTRALDEAGARISRYLLMQCTINGSFGVVVGLGLWLIGVPYAVIWGTLAAALRFIPYVGSFVAAFLTVALSLAVFPGWREPALVAGLFLALDLVIMMIEPWLYGQSAGVSQVALLIAVIFWTWLWGPVGLLLATPLTVCLIVLGKHLPALGFLVVLMGDRPVIEAKARYYQRLLARDQDEAADIVEAYVAADGDGRASVYDAVLVPALYYAKQDRDRGLLSDDDAQFVEGATREILDELALPPRGTGDLSVSDPGPDTRIRIVGCPARDGADALALEMLRHLLDPARYRLEVSALGMLTSEVVAGVDRHRPAFVCIGSVAPGGLSQARHLCKRLRAQCPELTIVVGRWGFHDEREADRQHLLAAGADYVETTVQDTQRALAQVPLTLGQPAPESPPPLAATAA